MIKLYRIAGSKTILIDEGDTLEDIAKNCLKYDLIRFNVDNLDDAINEFINYVKAAPNDYKILEIDDAEIIQKLNRLAYVQSLIDELESCDEEKLNLIYGDNFVKNKLKELYAEVEELEEEVN